MKKIILILSVIIAVVGCQKNSPAPSTVNQTQTTTQVPDTTIKVWCIYKSEAPNMGALLYCAKSFTEMQTKSQEYRNADIFVNVVGKTACSDC